MESGTVKPARRTTIEVLDAREKQRAKGALDPTIALRSPVLTYWSFPFSITRLSSVFFSAVELQSSRGFVDHSFIRAISRPVSRPTPIPIPTPTPATIPKPTPRPIFNPALGLNLWPPHRPFHRPAPNPTPIPTANLIQGRCEGVRQATTTSWRTGRLDSWLNRPSSQNKYAWKGWKTCLRRVGEARKHALMFSLS